MTSPLPSDLWRPSKWSTPPEEPARDRPTFVLQVVVLLVTWNILANTIWQDSDIPFMGFIGIVVLVAIARWAKTPWDYLGLSVQSMRRGMKIGLVGSGFVLLAVAATTALPLTRELFADDRFIGVSTGEMLYKVLVRIPLDTAVAEELAFRGVLLGMLLVWFSPLRATVISSALFGLWHILPGLAALDTNPAADVATGTLGTIAEVSVQVVVTALAGAAFAWLRFRGNSLITPILVHWALNGAAYLAGWLVVKNAWA